MIVTDKGTLDLEDSRVVSILRGAHEMRISFVHARLMQPGSDSFQLCNVTLALAGVSSESARLYIAHGVAAAHPDPARPLDTVEVFTHSQGRLNLQGMRLNRPWCEWEIAAQSLTLESVAFDMSAAQPVVAADAPKAARR